MRMTSFFGAALVLPFSLLAAENPAEVAVPQRGMEKRHQEKCALIAKEKFDLLMVGDSITHNFEKPAYQPVWNHYFAPRKAINLGYSGARTENIIWNLQNGELAGQSPKVITLMIGTNNADAKNYPTHHTGEQIAGGIKRIVEVMREKCPEAKILLLRCFPGAYGGPGPTEHRAVLDAASAIAMKLADDKHIFFCDVNAVYLESDGKIKKHLMPDWLHPNPEGARLWAETMEPLLARLLNETPKPPIAPLP